MVSELTVLLLFLIIIHNVLKIQANTMKFAIIKRYGAIALKSALKRDRREFCVKVNNRLPFKQ